MGTPWFSHQSSNQLFSVTPFQFCFYHTHKKCVYPLLWNLRSIGLVAEYSSEFGGWLQNTIHRPPNTLRFPDKEMRGLGIFWGGNSHGSINQMRGCLEFLCQKLFKEMAVFLPAFSCHLQRSIDNHRFLEYATWKPLNSGLPPNSKAYLTPAAQS